MGHRLGHHGSVLGLIGAMALAGLFGALVSIPTVRLRGLYLALATLAFASAMDTIFFTEVFGAYGGGLSVPRLHLPGIAIGSDRGFLVLVGVVFAVAAVGVLAIRRSRYGRKLAALNDSPAACATLGVNIAYTKLAVFTFAAALAGLGGALYGGVQHIVTPDDFQLFISLSVLLLLLIGGRNTVVGALLGGMFLAVASPIIQQHFPSFPNLQYLMTGVGAVTIGRNPDGIGGLVAQAADALRGLRVRRVEEVSVAPA
jgi:branched-chain amino acid transport system permease protein